MQPASPNADNGSGGWTRDTLRQLKLLVDPDRLGRWGLLVVLAVIVSGLELLGTVLVFALFAQIVSPGGEATLPLVGSLQERFPGVPDDRLLLYLAIAVAVFFVVRAVITLFQVYAQGRVTQNAGARLADRLLRGYLAMPYEWHLVRDPAELFRNAFATVGTLVQSVLVPAVTVISEALVVAAILAVLVMVQPVISVLTMAVLVPVTMLLMRLIQKRMTVLGRENQEANRASIWSLRESLDGIREITLYQRAADFRETFRGTRMDLARIGYLRTTLSRTPKLVMETLLVFLVATFVILTVTTGGSMSETLTVLGLFGYAAFRVLPSVSIIVEKANDLRYGEAVIDDLYEDVVATEHAVAADRDADRDEVPPLPFERSLRAQGIIYTYPNASQPAIRDISLEIPAGASVGIVGRTGGGKSTLVDLLLGLLEPNTGRILIDGRELAQHRRSWQRTVAVVPQTLFLISDSIRRNVAFTSREDWIDDERVWAALRQAQLDTFVANLPEGLDTQVGKQGIRLSGGQRQRIVIARALYHDPKVLVFDEGTASLDQRTEVELLDAVEGLMGERTLIHVAHRLATVRTCDRIFLIENGHLTAEGTFDELMADQPSFQDMVET